MTVLPSRLSLATLLAAPAVASHACHRGHATVAGAFASLAPAVGGNERAAGTVDTSVAARFGIVDVSSTSSVRWSGRAEPAFASSCALTRDSSSPLVTCMAAKASAGVVERGPPSTSPKDAGIDPIVSNRIKQRSKRHLRPSLFRTTNVYVQPTNVPPGFWDRLSPESRVSPATPVAAEAPEPWWRKWASSPAGDSSHHVGAGGGSCAGGGKSDVLVDASVAFDDPVEGAAELLSRCRPTPTGEDAIHPPDDGCCTTAGDGNERMGEVLEHLASCLRMFQETISDSSLSSSSSTQMATSLGQQRRRACRARIVATRGERGIKCPRWHVDHVPLRLICALEGPGVCYVDDDEVRDGVGVGRGMLNRRIVNSSEEVDTRVANEAIMRDVDPDRIRCASMGEVVLLVGKAWEDAEGEREDRGGDGEGGVSAAVHRSPDIRPGQRRVLLTVDVVLDEGEYDDD